MMNQRSILATSALAARCGRHVLALVPGSFITPSAALLSVCFWLTCVTASAYTPPAMRGSTLGGTLTKPFAVGSSGEVVGWASIPGDSEIHAFTWTESSGIVDLGTLGGKLSQATAVSDGHVVGWSSTPGHAAYHAFSWTQKGGMIDLGTLGGTLSQATSVADGQVVGWASTAGDLEIHAFRWTEADGMVDLGTLGGTFSRATGVSNGEVVGWALSSGNASGRAFRWTPRGGMVDAGELAEVSTSAGTLRLDERDEGSRASRLSQYGMSTSVVGSGTPADCTEAALDVALAGGGTVTFECGNDPVTIMVTSTKLIETDTVIEGVGLITLSGGGATGVFAVDWPASLTLTNVTVSSGSAARGGAVNNSGTLNVINSTLVHNGASGSGGAIWTDGSVTIASSYVVGNSASGNGGAIRNDGVVTLSNSTFSHNEGTEGGAIYNLSGLGATGCIFSNNRADRNGGGISGLGSIGRSVFSDNRAYVGGAIAGEIGISGSSFIANTAWFRGGAASFLYDSTVADSTFSGNTGGDRGGAIYTNSYLTVTSSTFSDNAATRGGAIYAWGNIQNSTFYRNTADQAGAVYGGGRITNSTFLANGANDGGAIYNGGTADEVVVTNTIVAGSLSGGNCAGAITDGGHNLQFPGTDCGESIRSADPLLDPMGLADNGGPTPTIALLPGSPGVDSGDDLQCPATDQRGFERVGSCDIGAYEFPLPRSGVVGTGTPESCTEAALDAALVWGGTIIFDCGNNPISITVTSTKVIATDTTIDGAGLVTLSGGTAVSVLAVNPGVTLNVARLRIVDGRGPYAGVTSADCGGAISNAGGRLAISDSTFSGNRGYCGAICNGGDLTVAGSTFSSNYDYGAGGGAICNGGALAIVDSTFTANGGCFNGGAIFASGATTIARSTFVYNDACNGGAIRGRATVSDSRFVGNRAPEEGGGAISAMGAIDVSNSTFLDNFGYQGGAINCGWKRCEETSNHELTVTGSTFSRNTAWFGGAIAGNLVTVTNTTFADNGYGGWGSFGSVSGGAIYGGTLTVTNSTFARNVAVGDVCCGAGGALNGSGTITNTIVANSLAGGNCWGTFVDGGHNLQFPDSDCGATIPSTDPLLDPAGLADHGGPTQTIALLPDSPAIDAGDDFVCAAPPVNSLDQRGLGRPGAGHTHCSIGSFEFHFEATATPTITSSETPMPVPTDTPTATHSATPAEVPSGAPTHTASATATVTPTSELTATPSATPTPTVRTADFIPGGGQLSNDCTHEWLTLPVSAPDRRGYPAARLECTDDNPECDFGAMVGDTACTFRIALCLNVTESRFACMSTDVARVELKQPRQEQPRDLLDLENRDALEAALASLGGIIRGRCRNNGPRRGQFCGTGSDCDATPGSGDGLCKGRFVAFVPPLSAVDRCTTLASITVPLDANGSARGIKRLRLSVSPSADPVTGRSRRSDKDSLTLICKPR
jgi:probable HAF family extracellular repeat protein/predicted outer membrane repeat protein